MSRSKSSLAVAQAALLLTLLVAGPARSEPPPEPDPHAHHHTARADAHAPIGVMVDHTHAAGEVMLSYRYSRMTMTGNRDGTDRVSLQDVLAQYPVAPRSMDMEMHMFGLMYAPIDQLTLALMVPYTRLSMEHTTRMGVDFTTKTDGLGDIRLSGLVPVLATPDHKLHLSLGLSFPTGSIDERGRTPAGNVQLPYPMQLGSGTFDLLPGATYLGSAEAWSWGGQLLGDIRLGENSADYRLGHGYELTGWLSRSWLPWLSTAFRLDWRQWGNYEGADPDLNPRVVPTADPSLRAGRRLDALLSVNFLVTNGVLAGNRFGVEVGVPIYQRLTGPQLEADWRLIAGWQYAF